MTDLELDAITDAITRIIRASRPEGTAAADDIHRTHLQKFLLWAQWEGMMEPEHIGIGLSYIKALYAAVKPDPAKNYLILDKGDVKICAIAFMLAVKMTNDTPYCNAAFALTLYATNPTLNIVYQWCNEYWYKNLGYDDSHFKYLANFCKKYNSSSDQSIHFASTARVFQGFDAQTTLELITNYFAQHAFFSLRSNENKNAKTEGYFDHFNALEIAFIKRLHFQLTLNRADINAFNKEIFPKRTSSNDEVWQPTSYVEEFTPLPLASEEDADHVKAMACALAGEEAMHKKETLLTFSYTNYLQQKYFKDPATVCPRQGITVKQ